MRRLTRILLILLLTAVALKPASLSASDSGKIVTASLSGTVSAQMGEFVIRVIEHAERENAGLVVFKLDTTGGLAEVARGITEAILNSNVPVAVWVPPGGSAASAGSFIMQAAHVAAMAPGTTIGAAHPAVASGGDVSYGDMRQKVMNDLMTQMRTLTQMRGRNERAAQRMVEENLSLTAHEALEENAIDIVAGDIDSLIYAANGRMVEVRGQRTTIDVLPDASIEHMAMSPQEQLIQFLANPNVAYLLLIGGVLVISYGIITGDFIAGIIGAAMLLLSGTGLNMLPFNWVGVALIVAGAVIMGIEFMTAGTGGLLGLLGTATMITGGVFLFRAPGAELLDVSISLVVGTGIALGICFMFFAMLITKSLKAKVETGGEGLVGHDVEVIEDLAPEGTVKFRGETWKARVNGENLHRGTRAVIVLVEGITLIVESKATESR